MDERPIALRAVKDHPPKREHAVSGLPTGIRLISGDGNPTPVRLASVEVSLDAYRSVVDAIDDVVFRLDPAGRWIFLNPAWQRITGASVGRTLGRSFLDSIHPDDRHAHALQLHRLISGTVESLRLELRFLKSDGSTCWVQLNGRRTVDDDTFTGVSGTLHDITDRKHIENTLALSELRFKAVFEHAGVGILVALPDGRLLSVNPALERMLGYRDSALRGRPLVEVAAPESKSTFRDAMESLLTGRKEECKIELRCRTRTDASLDVQFHGSLIRDNDLQPLLIVGLLEDLSERKATEQRLVKAKEEAESVARLKSALLNNVSHEVRTPLTTIIGYATLLAEEVPEDLREFAHTISLGGQRLLDTLNAVLELARLESNPSPSNLILLDVALEVAQVLDLVLPLADQKGLEVRIALPDEPLNVLADGNSLLRVLNNLLSNAVKFTEHGYIEVAVDASPDQVWIAVTDTGVGISEEFLPQLFKEFRQESSGLGRSHEGSGLGLAISRRLVDQMGGTLQVSSRKGEGSTFTITLPRA